MKPIAHQIEVTLEDLYNGREFEFTVDRHRKCAKCNGVGGTDPSAIQKCSSCKGKGQRVVMQQLGPGMYS